MQTISSQTQINQPQLQAQLRFFGLNPLEWNLIPQSEEQVRLVSRTQDDFELIGILDGTRQAWQELTLQVDFN